MLNLSGCCIFCNNYILTSSWLNMQNLIIVYTVKLPFFHCLQIVFECNFIVSSLILCSFSGLNKGENQA